MESTEPWTSPSAAQITFPSIQLVLPGLNSPPATPPSLTRPNPQRSIAKAPALRVITSFGDADGNMRAQIFHENGGATPLAAGVTPIATSAMPMGLLCDNDVTTAFLRPSQHSVFNTPSSALPNGRYFGHQSLPESDVNVSGKTSQSTITDFANFPAEISSFPIYSSLQQSRKNPSSPVSLTTVSDGCNSRNGPRNRILVEKQLQLVPIKSSATDSILPEQKDPLPQRYRWPIRRRGPGSVSSSVTSISSATHGTFSDRTRVGDVSGTDEALNEYISSLEINAKAVRVAGTDRHPESNTTHQHRPSATVLLPTHHSPEPSATVQGFITDASATPLSAPLQRHVRNYSESRQSSHASSHSRAIGKQSHESRPFTLELPRGRNVSRATSSARSPSSPLPFSENGADYHDSDADEDDLRALYAHEKLRSQDYTSLRGRSSSHDRLTALPGSVNALDEPSGSIYVPLRKNRAQTGPPPAPSALSLSSGMTFKRHPPSQHTVGEQLDRRQTQSAMANRGDLRELSLNGRAHRKAEAAQELQDRRMSLFRQTLTPSIVHPKNLQMERKQAFAHKFDMGGQSSDISTDLSNLPPRSQSTEPTGMTRFSAMSSRTRGAFAPDSPSIVLAATPEAMRRASGTSGFHNVSKQSDSGLSPAPLSQQSSEENTSPKREEQQQPLSFKSSASLSTSHLDVPNSGASIAAKLEDTLTLLPSTVYRPPPINRAVLPRSLSAPPEKLAYHKRSVSQNSFISRKEGSGQSKNDESAISSSHRPSLENSVPQEQQSLTAPPRLKELAHLAVPPPPPPPPTSLPFNRGAKTTPVIYGGHTSGTIEMVMDDGETESHYSSAAVSVAKWS